MAVLSMCCMRLNLYDDGPADHANSAESRLGLLVEAVRPERAKAGRMALARCLRGHRIDDETIIRAGFAPSANQQQSLALHQDQTHSPFMQGSFRSNA